MKTTKFQLKEEYNNKSTTFINDGVSVMFDGYNDYSQEKLERLYKSKAYNFLVEEVDVNAEPKTKNDKKYDFELTYVNGLKQEEQLEILGDALGDKPKETEETPKSIKVEKVAKTTKPKTKTKK